MEDNSISFTETGSKLVSKRLRSMSDEAQVQYLFSFINQIGQLTGHLPTESFEKKVLFELNRVLPQKLSQTVQQSTLSLLKQNRQKRAIESAPVIISTQKFENEIKKSNSRRILTTRIKIR